MHRFQFGGRARNCALLSASVVSLLAVGATAAFGQDTTVPDNGIESVTVTSTRVAREGYTAPTPTTVLGVDEIEQRATSNIADALNILPSLDASTTPSTGNGNSGAQLGQNLLNLRGLGVNRTLVLLDGQRITPNNATGNVDINLLPSALVQRVDVVTGGASADWGSDAVAGVVNFVLDKKYEGFKGNFQVGETGYGDGKSLQGSLTYGDSFAGGQGHFEISGQYLNRGTVAGAATTGRSWYQGWKVLGNPNGTATDILLPHVGLATATDGGLITSGPLKNIQFVGPTGTPAVFVPGFISGSESVYGTAEDDGGRLQLQAPGQQGNVFGRASYDLTPDMNLFVEANYGNSHAVAQSVPFNRLGNLTISSGNPFIPAGVQAQLTASKIPTFGFGTTNQQMGFEEVYNDAQTESFTGGVEGKFGDSWTWDAHVQHGQYNESSLITDDPIIANYNLALDAVTNPATGAPICRSTLANPNNGCAPLDAFGTAQISSAAKSYVMGTGKYFLGTYQNDLAANIRGEPFSLWAGPVSIAVGGEYRREGFTLKSSALDQTNSFFTGDTVPANGMYDVEEGYAEAVVPLLSGMDLAKELDLNGSVRETNYSTSGAVTTWKLGLTYDVNDDFRLRTTRSTDIRAPNLLELFQKGFTSTSVTADPTTKTSYQVSSIGTGNPNLVPEVANTTSGGVVLTPHWVPGLTASIDYFGINISHAILSLTGQQIINACAASYTSVCPLITRGTNGLITTVFVSPANAQSESTAGLDMSLTYHSDLANLIDNWEGALTFRGNATNTWDHSINAVGQTIQYAGTDGDGGYATPRWRGLLSATYDLDRFSGTLTARYIGSGVISYRTPIIVNNGVASTTYLDLGLSYQALDAVQVYFAVNNLTDQAPPPTPQVFSTPHLNTGANDYIYDVLGRQFKLGVRFAM